MESKKVNIKVLKKTGLAESQLQTTNIDYLNSRDYPKNPDESLSIKSKDFIPKEYSKHTSCEKRYVKRTNNNINKIYEDKEEKLVNLIVKIVVKSTLEQLYGKEGN